MSFSKPSAAGERKPRREKKRVEAEHFAQNASRGSRFPFFVASIGLPYKEDDFGKCGAEREQLEEPLIDRKDLYAYGQLRASMNQNNNE